MSDKFIPYHLRDINDPPGHLDDQQKANWISAAKKAFDIPTSLYEIIYANKYTTTETMQKLIDHVRNCNEFTFDSEGEKSTKQLALIQIQTIPQQLPFFVILVECAHLPPINSLIHLRIKQLFELIFKFRDNIYSWKPLHKEIYPAIVYQWFEWHIKTSVVNLQLKFADWYSWALSHDKMCTLSNHRNIIINDINSDEQMNLLSKCTCHKSSLYRPNEPWVLQQALLYTYGMFIDKSITVNHWTTELDPMYSTLSTSKRNKMIHYAIYDCFATTCLIRSALPSSSSRANNNSANTNINQRIIKNINDDIELISDDDKITVNQCIKITINNDMLYEEISNDDNELNKALSLNHNESLYEVISDDDNEPNPALPPNDNDLRVINHDMVDDVSDYEQQQQQSLTKKRQLHSRTRSAEARKR
ncbi:unnamed protein product [Rotaria sordida]|uniref:Uncharacterized protein n=1 Tax=Rotaria sordida TaxID=392033 RepID=A0A815FS78_9BILA|nr:unnamed protein product [Rotaria sordida]CAF1329954.1 unnamed protein product [Rotaria sordida]CAF1590831.1 unnamed protein product [Rotaria sordida]CAF1591044.1 unnamed protein product [Rotaria sordida]